MSGFPGSTYDSDGNSLHAGVPDLTQALLDSYPCRAMVTVADVAIPARIWLVADDARFGNLHPVIVTEAIGLLLGGAGVLVLAQDAAAEASIRDGLLNALDLAVASHEAAGHA